MNIPHYIRTVRQRAGLSQAKFADFLQTTRSKIANYETGRSRAPADLFLAVQEFDFQHNRKDASSNKKSVFNTIKKFLSLN